MRRHKSWYVLLTFITLGLTSITLPHAAPGGRNPVRCAQTCQMVQAACGERFEAFCLAEYSKNDDEYAACRIAAKTQCIQVDDDCRQRCAQLKDSGPEEP